MKFKKGSSNTGDYTVKDDPTHENYMALLTAIMIEEDTPDYKKLVYNKLLFDKREEKRRLEEIDKYDPLTQEDMYDKPFITGFYLL